jgi:TatD DNase family protein
MLPADELGMARAGIALAQEHDGLFASAGIHPHHASSVDEGVLRELEALLGDERVVALGEIGLDYFYMHSSRDEQIAAFVQQLQIAWWLGLPVIVHSRDAWEDTMAILGAWVRGLSAPMPPSLANRTDIDLPPSRSGPLGVMHYFTGSLEDGLQFVEMGFLLSIHTSVTFKSAGAMREIVAQLPLESLVIETDSPFGAPQGYRGKRNEPAYVLEVAKMIAELQGVSVEEVAEATYVNACRLFRLPVEGLRSAG